jgi:hypothetical protein
MLGLLVGLTILVGGAVAVALHPVRFESDASVVVLDAMAVEDLERELGEHVDRFGQSPLARDSPRSVADLLTRIYSSWSKQQELAAQGFAGTLAVSNILKMDDMIPIYGPTMSIVVRSGTADGAVAGATLVIDDIANELAERQRVYDPRLSVHIVVTTQPTAARATSGSRTRAAMAFMILAVLLGRLTTWLLSKFAHDGEAVVDHTLDGAVPQPQ